MTGNPSFISNQSPLSEVCDHVLLAQSFASGSGGGQALRLLPLTAEREEASLAALRNQLITEGKSIQALILDKYVNFCRNSQVKYSPLPITGIKACLYILKVFSEEPQPNLKEKLANAIEGWRKISDAIIGADMGSTESIWACKALRQLTGRDEHSSVVGGLNKRKLTHLSQGSEDHYSGDMANSLPARQRLRSSTVGTEQSDHPNHLGSDSISCQMASGLSSMARETSSTQLTVAGSNRSFAIGAAADLNVQGVVGAQPVTQNSVTSYQPRKSDDPYQNFAPKSHLPPTYASYSAPHRQGRPVDAIGPTLYNPLIPGSSQPQHVIASQKLICSSDQVNVPGGQAFPLCQIPPSRSVFGTAVRNSDKISSKSPIRTWERTIRSLDVAISGMLEKIKPKIWNPLNLNSIYTPQPYTPSFQWTPRNIAAPASYELPDGITTSLFHSESGISIITAAPSVTAQPLSERTIESKSSSVKNVSSEGSLLNTETEGQGAVKTSLDTDYSVNPTSRSSRNCSPTSEYPNPAPAITTLSKSASSQSEKYFSRKSGLSKSFRRSNTPTHFSSVRLESEAQRKKFVEAYNQLTGASTSCGASKGDCELASDMPSPALPSKTEKALSAKAQRPQATLPDTFSVNNITEEQKLFFVKTYNEVSAQGKARLEENMRKYNLWELLGPLVASKVPTDNVSTFSPLGSSQNLSKAPGILISNQTSQSNLTLNSTPTQTVKLNFNGEKRDRPGSLLPLIREMAIAMLKSEPLSTAVIMAAFGSLGFSDDVLIMSHLQSIANYSSGPTGLWHLCEKKAANSSQKVSTESSPSVGATKLLDDRTRSPSLLSTNSQSNAQQDAPVHSGNQSSQFSNIPSFSVSEPIESVKLKLTTEQHNAETIQSSKLSLPLSETLSEESLISRINPALFNETCASSNRTPLNTSASTIRPQNMSLCGSGKPIFLLGGKAKPVDLEDKKLKSTFSDPSVTSIHQGSQVRQKEQILKIASSDFQNSIASEKTPSVRPEDQQSRSSSTELNLQLAKQPSTLGSKLVMMESEEQQSNTTPVWLKSSSQMLQGSYLKPQSALNYEIDIGKRKRNQTRQIKKSIKYCEPYKDDLPGFPDVNPSIQIKGTRAKILLRYPHDQQMAPIRTFYPLLLVEKSNS